MTVRRVAISLAALPVALILGCEREPGRQIATDRAVRDAGADGGSDRGGIACRRLGRRWPDGAATQSRPMQRRARPADAAGDAGPADAGPADAAVVEAGRADGGGGEAAFELLGAPLVFAPTPRGFGLSVVLRAGDPTALALRVRDEELSAWSVLGPPLSPAFDIAQWMVDGLAPGRRYIYEVSAPTAAGQSPAGAALQARSVPLSFFTRGAPPRPRPRGLRSASPSSPTRTSSHAIRFRRGTPSSMTSTG